MGKSVPRENHEEKKWGYFSICIPLKGGISVFEVSVPPSSLSPQERATYQTILKTLPLLPLFSSFYSQQMIWVSQPVTSCQYMSMYTYCTPGGSMNENPSFVRTLSTTGLTAFCQNILRENCRGWKSETLEYERENAPLLKWRQHKSYSHLYDHSFKCFRQCGCT